MKVFILIFTFLGVVNSSWGGADFLLDEKKQEITMSAKLILYGDVTEDFAGKLASSIQNVWSPAGVKILIRGVPYAFHTLITFEILTQMQTSMHARINREPNVNYWLVQNGGESDQSHLIEWGGNVGVLYLSDHPIDGKGIAHELGHSLGLPDSENPDCGGPGTPSIMCTGGMPLSASRVVLQADVEQLNIDGLNFRENKASLGKALHQIVRSSER